MPVSMLHVTPSTPMGCNLVADGATFRVWGPRAHRVHAIGDFNGWRVDDDSLLNLDAQGHWLGFVPGVEDRQRYMFHVVGDAGEGPKRDPYARELDTPFPGKCIVRSTDFPWHEGGYVAPGFDALVIYQLHVGTFFTPNRPRRNGTFLDVALKLPYLAELGVSALQLLPIQEFQTQFSKGYNGTDYFSPEMDYGVPDTELAPYVEALNALLAARRQAPYRAQDLRGEMNQLKALVDLAHLHGLAVLFDVVYNHAGGDFGDESGIYFFDRQVKADDRDQTNSLYFTSTGHAGGLVFDFSKPQVCAFLLDNARFLFDEYRIDGLRYDQVSVIDHDGAPHGWRFCQDLTATLRFHRPGSLHHAEYWPVNPWVVAPVGEGGAGFDLTLTDGLRLALRDVIANASQPDERALAMERLGHSLRTPGLGPAWRGVQGPENHDLVYRDRELRIARLGQPQDPRSWHGRSRARVATGLSLCAPGTPMLFMGQELLEDKPWADHLDFHADLLLDWAGLERGDRQMLDHLRFVRELLALRRRLPGLRGEGFHLIHAHDGNRVLAFQRWVEGEGHDVVVVAHLSPFHRFGYRIGFPAGGGWAEVFNSDVYESWVNPAVAGNGGSVFAGPEPLHGLGWSAALTLPANSVLVFAR